MSIENKSFSHQEVGNINNSLSKSEELLQTKETLEKRETIGDQEKLESYINYLVDWKNDLVKKQEEVTKQLQEISTEEGRARFYFPLVDKTSPNGIRVGLSEVETVFSKLAEQCQEIQNGRNNWAKSVSSSFLPSPYNARDLDLKQKNGEMQNYVFAPIDEVTNENSFPISTRITKFGEAIKALGLNIYEHQAVVIPKDVLKGELPLYEKVEQDDSTFQRWLRIKDNKFIVETKYFEDGEESDNFSRNDKEYRTYKEAVKGFKI